MLLRVYLAIKDITINEFSAKLDYHRSYITRIVHGELMPGAELIKKIEELTDGSVLVSDHLQQCKTYLKKEKLKITRAKNKNTPNDNCSEYNAHPDEYWCSNCLT